MKNGIHTFLSCAAVLISVWALIEQPIETELQPMEDFWVQLSPWPIDKFIIDPSENKTDSPQMKLSVDMINGSQRNRKCFVQVDGKGFGIGTQTDALYRLYVSRVIELSGVQTEACRTRIDILVQPSEEDLFSYNSVRNFYLDVKVVDYESREIVFRKRCYYFWAIEGDENLHLYKPVELHPSDSEKYKDCECVPKPVHDYMKP